MNKNKLNLKKRINPETGMPYVRGEIIDNKIMFRTISLQKHPADYDGKYILYETYDFEQYIEKFAKETVHRRNHYVKIGRIESHNITEKHLIDIFPRNLVCPVFQIKMTLKSGQVNSIELDRINRNLNYEDGNVAWISAKANRCKGDSNSKELLQIAKQ